MCNHLRNFRLLSAFIREQLFVCVVFLWQRDLFYWARGTVLCRASWLIPSSLLGLLPMTSVTKASPLVMGTRGTPNPITRVAPTSSPASSSPRTNGTPTTTPGKTLRYMLCLWCIIFSFVPVHSNAVRERVVGFRCKWSEAPYHLTTLTHAWYLYHSAEELAQKKRMVEQRLREKEKRLSRLSQAINGNSNASKQTQQDVNHMAEKLKKMQNLLAKNEQVWPYHPSRLPATWYWWCW